MIERYGQWIIRWRYFVILATLVLVWLTTMGFPLQIGVDYRAYFSEENPQLIAFEELQNTYTKNENVLFVLAPKDGQVFTNQTLDAVEWLTKEAWQVPYSSRVNSITNFQHSYAEEDDLIVEDLVTNALVLSPKDIAKIKEIALTDPQLLNMLISPQAHVTGVNVIIQLPGVRKDKEMPEIVVFVRDLVKQLRSRYPHLDVYLTGKIMFMNAAPETIGKDLSTLVPMMYIMIFVVLWLLLRSFSGTFATFLIISFAAIGAMGLAGLFELVLTGTSTYSPIFILTLAVADSVHFLVSMRHEMRVNGQEKRAAIVESLRVNFQPIFLTSLTTAIGFLSMNFSEVPPYQDLGNIIAMGIVIAFILSVSFLPALMAVLPIYWKKQTGQTILVMDRFGDFVIAKRNGLLWGMAVVMVLLISFVPRNELNDVYVDFYDETIDFRQANDFATENLTGGAYSIHYSLSSGEPDGISKPEFLRVVEQFVEWYRQQPEVTHVSSIIDTFKRLNKNLHGGNPNYYRLPEQHDLAAQYLVLYEMSLPYGLDLNNQIDVDKSATRVGVTLKKLSTNEILALEQRAQQWLQQHGLPSMQTLGTGVSIMFANIGARNIRSMLLGTGIALILISIILIFALRSVKFGLISLIPNIAPIAMAFGIWGLLVGEIGIALSIIASLTIGIVVDDTIHYLSRYLRARREKGLAATDAVRYAFHSVGLALWVTTAVLVAGFLILSQSHYYVNFTLGVMTAVTITIALLADFLFLPPLLIKLEEKKP